MVSKTYSLGCLALCASLYAVGVLSSCTTNTNGQLIECGMSEADQFVDDLISIVRSKLSSEPVPLPNREGIVSLTAGQLWGMDTLNRTGPIEFRCNGSSMFIVVPLATDKAIRARYDWDKRVAGTKTVKGVAHARASSAQGQMVLRRERLLGFDLPPRVDDVSVHPAIDVEVNVSGLANISWLWSRAITFMTSSLHKSLAAAATDRLRVVIEEALKNLF